MSKEYKILSIDAWAGMEEGLWEWNAWYNAGIFTGDIEDNNKILQFMIEHDYLASEALKECEVIDDQYNLVITEKRTGRPLYAIEYGNII